MPEKLRGSQLLGYSSAIDCHKRLVGPLAQLVYALGHILLAGTACPIYQYRHVGGCNQAHIGVELPGRFALPLEIARCFRLARVLLYRPLRLGSRNRSPKRLVDFLQQVLGIDRFGHIVFRSQFHGLNSRRDSCITCHHDYRYQTTTALEPLQQIDTLAVGQTQIAQYQIDRFVVQRLASRSNTGCRGNGKAFLGEPRLQHQGKRCIVLDDKNMFHRCSSFFNMD